MTDPSGPVRVVVADDQALVRTGFRMILSADGIDVVAEAANGTEAVEAARRTRPDVVLMDIRMPGMDGLEATRRILAAEGECPRVLMLTTFDLDEYVYAALAAGASRASSRAAARTASTRDSGGASLRRNPHAPAFRAL